MTIMTEDIKSNISLVLDNIRRKDYQKAKELVSHIYSKVENSNLPDVISSCWSLNAFLKYEHCFIQRFQIKKWN